jgi:DNA-binding transcriptional ArsR family regulator
MKNTGREAEMREQMATAVAELISSMHPDFRELALQDADVTRLLRAANIATLARTGVETDYRGDIIDAHAQEMPTRFAKQLNQIMRGGIAIGMSRDTSLALALRCARDSVPQLRLEVLRDLDKHSESSVSQVRIRLQKPWRTINRALEALHTLDLISVREEEDVEDGKSTLFYSLTERTQRGLKALI